jgi:hypothetical protein
MNRFLRICRTMHSWLGALVMPWVLIIGATGFYLNHAQSVLELLGQTELSQSDLDNLTELPVTAQMVRQIAETVWPDLPILDTNLVNYLGRQSFGFKKASGFIFVPASWTGYYFVETTLSRQTYALDGKLLHAQYNLKRIFKSLHETGWIGNGLGTWLADIVAVAMIFFSLSGITMWSVPKLRKLRGLAARRRKTATR